MIPVRVLADDLTGALDAAARFLPLTGPLPVLWKPPPHLSGSAAIDASTRELAEPEARAMADRLAATLEDADIAFKKIDSLLRGHVAAELAACARRFDHCIVAPAFPFQGRVTRQGQQMLHAADQWRDVGLDLPEMLRRERLKPVLCVPGDPAPKGLSLWDAETNSHLAAIVAAARELPGGILWCGTGGLAGALAGGGAPSAPPLPTPILALIGSDHPASVAQLSAAWAHVQRISRGGPDEAAPIARLLARAPAAVAVSVPPGRSRDAARRHITACLTALLDQLDRPGTLIIAGGETLRSVCDHLDAGELEVDGEIMPGVPTSILCGGRWDGLRVVSKSGAFGDPGLLLRLLAPDRHGDLA